MTRLCRVTFSVAMTEAVLESQRGSECVRRTRWLAARSIHCGWIAAQVRA